MARYTIKHVRKGDYVCAAISMDQVNGWESEQRLYVGDICIPSSEWKNFRSMLTAGAIYGTMNTLSKNEVTFIPDDYSDLDDDSPYNLSINDQDKDEET